MLKKENVSVNIIIRSERPDDSSAIHALTEAAFASEPHSSHTEQFIVKALRESGHLTLSLVAESEGDVIGHVAISPVSISSEASGWFGLGPISVCPHRQGQGIGSQLMRAALEELKKLGGQGCVVLGDPNYYGRFDFKVHPELTFPGVPAEYFQALSFNGAFPNGEVRYHEAFEATS